MYFGGNVASVPKQSHALRSRFQLLAGIIVAVVLPVAVRWLATGVGIDDRQLLSTAIGGAIALILGYLFYLRLHVLPGFASGGYIITSFSVAFALLATTLIMLRIDYSRLQLLSSYVLTIGFFTFIHLKFVARRPLRLGVVPQGATNALIAFKRVYWHPIHSPDDALPPLNGIVVDLNADHDDRWNSRIAAFALQGMPVYHVTEVLEQLSGRVSITRLSDNTLGSLNPNDAYLKLKAGVDTVAALMMLVVAAPVMAIVAIAIRLDSPGPALFRQARTGFRAVPFTIYKFRTMRVEAVDPATSRAQAMTQADDPRITRLGAFLRKSRLDELPQLINILKGEMSLIGPRPEVVALTEWYEKEIPFYHYRHIIKPGITGWAQVNLGHVTDVEDIRAKLDFDFYYVKNFSAWLDLLIALRTAKTMFTGSGAK